MRHSKKLLFALIASTMFLTFCGEDDEDVCSEVTWYQDIDEDGLGNPDVSIKSCDQPDGYVEDNTDDADCIETTWYQDIDEDGLGNPDVNTQACDQPDGYVADNTDDADCIETTWYQDLDEDGLGNPDVSITACDQPDGYVADDTDTQDTPATATPVDAFDEFNSDAVTVSFDGNEINIESNGLPNHTTPYWPSDNPLHIDAVVAIALTPGAIRGSSYTVTVPSAPELASSSTATGLGPIGISVTGVPIFNDLEGDNRPIEEVIAETFDYAGAHNGPSGYHYHAESSDVPENTVLSHDDEQLVGIMADGFLLYGRKCNSIGDHPTDLDVSGGHTSSTQHGDSEEFYHYHIINEIYVGTIIALFPGDLQGTPNDIQ